MASNADSNTGVRNELVSVYDELLRYNFLDKLKIQNNNFAIIKFQ